MISSQECKERYGCDVFELETTSPFGHYLRPGANVGPFSVKRIRGCHFLLDSIMAFETALETCKEIMVRRRARGGHSINTLLRISLGFLFRPLRPAAGSGGRDCWCLNR